MQTAEERWTALGYTKESKQCVLSFCSDSRYELIDIIAICYSNGKPVFCCEQWQDSPRGHYESWHQKKVGVYYGTSETIETIMGNDKNEFECLRCGAIILEPRHLKVRVHNIMDQLAYFPLGRCIAAAIVNTSTTCPMTTTCRTTRTSN